MRDFENSTSHYSVKRSLYRTERGEVLKVREINGINDL